ncbi:MAG: hypothetical protein KDH15_22565 [Rhodocyclaceae bacterium]|nr:hypothetical protein [Rhodocyclaceae bacterium]
MIPRKLGSLLLPAALVTACAGYPPAADTSPSANVRPEESLFEKRQLARARSSAQAGDHREAAIAWEILALYDPGEPRYRSEMQGARRRAVEEASRQLGNARSARAAGNELAAVRHYLLALANDPALGEAANGLRELERTRNRRYFLGRSTRQTIGRPDHYLTEPAPAAKPASARPARPPAEAVETVVDSNALEHAALLRRDGEFTEALALLTRYLASHPDNEQAGRQLAETWEEFGDKSLRSGRLRAALRAYERARSYARDGADALGAKIDALRRSLGDAS